MLHVKISSIFTFFISAINRLPNVISTLWDSVKSPESIEPIRMAIGEENGLALVRRSQKGATHTTNTHFCPSFPESRLHSETMNYHRFESILAASPRPPQSRPSSSADVHPAAESDDNDSVQQPQQHAPFRRAHSMRASFTSLRSLKTRLKHPVVSGYYSSGGTRYTPLTGSPCRTASPHPQHIHHSTSTTTTSTGHSTLTTAAAAAAKANVKAKLLRLKESYAEFRRLQSRKLGRDNVTSTAASIIGSDNFKVPENMPPKAAALLLEGAGPRGRVRRSQSLRCGDADRYGVTIGSRPVSLQEELPKKESLGNGGNRLTVNRVSIKMGVPRRLEAAKIAENDENGGNLTVVRTATIRRSSVWANSSSSSKEAFALIFYFECRLYL